MTYSNSTQYTTEVLTNDDCANKYTVEPLYITDTIALGPSKLVLLLKVSFIEGSFNIIKYQNGTRKVSLVARCP